MCICNLFIKELLSCHILDWQDNYIDSDIFDGVQLVIRLHLANVKIIDKGGSNAYLPHWKKWTVMEIKQWS